MSVTHSIDVWLEQVSDSLKHAVAGWQFIVGESLSRVDLSHTQGERTALFVSLLSFFFCFVKRRGYELNTIFGTHTHTQWVKGTYLLKTCSVQQAQNIEVKTLNQGFHLKCFLYFVFCYFWFEFQEKWVSFEAVLMVLRWPNAVDRTLKSQNSLTSSEILKGAGCTQGQVS